MADYKKGQGYPGGNISDLVKHSNLEQLARLANPRAYIEFHSGEGKYKDYEGSALRVLRIMDSQLKDYKAFLHEIDEDRKNNLETNTSEFEKHLSIRGDWKEHVKKYIKQADPTFLFLLDPTYMEEYSEHKGLLRYLPKLLNTGANIFMFAPQKLKEPEHKQTISKIRSTIKKSGRAAVDLMHPTVKGGHYARTDHNIIVTDKKILDKIINTHNKTFSRFLKYKRFKEFKDSFHFI